MRRVVVVVALVLVAVPAARAADPPPLPARTQLIADRAQFLRLAEEGLATTKKLWWNEKLGWYDDRLEDTDRLPLATLWSIYPLFEATNAVAVAHPTKANKARANWFARQATKYWNAELKPVPGFGYYYTARGANWNAYMDDNGWWGLAYLDAYRATGNKTWLTWAARALRYMDVVGWDTKGGGGMWWDADQHKKTSEGLAAATLIAADLYRITHRKPYLALAKKYLAWANAKTVNRRQGNLYGRSDTDPTVMNYVEGMFVAAHAELCTATKMKAYCAKARKLANASLVQFPILADWAPETDVVYLRWMLDLYQRDKNARWYALVYANAKRAIANARDDQGLWSKRWDGDWTKPGLLRTQAGTLALLAWTATATPPTALKWRR
jgi:uncharacterized protein YyaL (SSP411 family)